MEINATIKNEVTNHMKKLAKDTNTFCAKWCSAFDFDEEHVVFQFKESTTGPIIVEYEIKYFEIEDIFDAIRKIDDDYKNKILERRIPNYNGVGLDISEYLKIDVEQAKRIDKMVRNSVFGSGAFKPHTSFNMKTPRKPIPDIENVIFNAPATIVFWNDGTKTVVKAQDDDVYDPEKGLAMAIAKKAFGNKRDYYHVFLRWLKKYENERTDNTATVDNIWASYHRLHNALHDKKATKADLIFAMQDAVGYLGEEMDK